MRSCGIANHLVERPLLVKDMPRCQPFGIDHEIGQASCCRRSAASTRHVVSIEGLRMDGKTEQPGSVSNQWSYRSA
jgi:hypothetical protein